MILKANLSFFLLGLFLMGQGAHAKFISLSPTITEVIYALEVDKDLVGVTDYCRYPESALSKPKIGSGITPNYEAIMKLAPSFALGQSFKNGQAQQKLRELGIALYSYDFDNLEGIKISISKMGRVLASPNRKTLVEKIEAKEKMLKKLNLKGSFLAIIDINEKLGKMTSVMAAGEKTFYSDILELVGLKNLSENNRGGYASFNIEKILKNKPDYIFLFNFEENDKAKVMRKELKNYGLKTKIYSYTGSHAVVPGPRLTQLMSEISKDLIK